MGKIQYSVFLSGVAYLVFPIFMVCLVVPGIVMGQSLADTKIAFSSDHDGNYEIYVMNTELTASGAGGTVIAAWEVAR